MKNIYKKKAVAFVAVILLLGTVSIFKASSLEAATGRTQISAEYREKIRRFFEYIRSLQQGTTPVVTTTPTPVVPSSSPVPTVHPVNGIVGEGNAMAFGVWNPADPKFAGGGPQKYPTCSKAFHDSFFVIGPDGKKYPTWHPAVAVDPSSGIKCTFGHEHGRDPSKSTLWPEVQSYFYFDANKNGKIDPEEQKVTGVPFGYANEQLDIYSASKGQAIMRHEDHFGNKVEYINGEADSSGEFGSAATGGIVIPIRTESTPKWRDSGAKCTYFSVIHQGVHSADAFTNNLHAVSFFADCKGPTPQYDMKAAVTNLVSFGASGEFSNLCDAEGDRTTPVVIGRNEMNQNYPGIRGNGFRNIIQRSCVEKYFLVSAGKFSMNAYEAWASSLHVRSATKTILSDINVTLDVEDAIRYYDPNKTNKIGYFMDLCYEVLPNGNQARGTCNSTHYGNIKGITWNDTRSDYKGIHRGMYYQGPRIFNSGGPEIWYTDPFGNNAQTTPFTGSIKQIVSSKNVDYLNLGNIDPRNTDRVHDDGEGTVHAPN